MIVSPEKAVEVLMGEGVVALPTETVYGLAGRFNSLAAIQKIFATKQRPSFDPLILHVTNSEQAQSITHGWSAAHSLLAEAFWPGPLTMVLDKQVSVSEVITSGLPTVAVRSPNHPLFQRVLFDLGAPLAAPSANMFSKTSPTSASHVEEEFSGQVPVVDGGECQAGIESSIVLLSEVDETQKRVCISVLRLGLISKEHIVQTLENAGWRVSVKEASKVMAPGKLNVHYQPKVPLVLFDPQRTTRAECFRKIGINEKEAKTMCLPDNALEAARALYALLRQFKSQECEAIACEWRHGSNPQSPWDAVFDRLKKASTHRFL